MKWAYLIHLGQKMWHRSQKRNENYRGAMPTIEEGTLNILCDKEAWTKLTDEISRMGLGTLIIDLGEGVKYNSHPELSAPNAWSVEELKTEINRLSKMGIKCIPKLNFSTSHSMWLGEYYKMLCTDTYYKVCSELIDEVCEIFDYPELFHFEMDDEDAAYQAEKEYPIVLCRQDDLWWHDTKFFIDCIEKNNVRPWLWCSKFYERNKEEFVKKMPQNVLISYFIHSNDYVYHKSFKFPGQTGYDDKNAICRNYDYLQQHGFEQIPCGSTLEIFEDVELMARYCKNELSPESLKGFMVAPWQLVTKYSLYYLLSAADVLRQVKEFDYGDNTGEVRHG